MMSVNRPTSKPVAWKRLRAYAVKKFKGIPARMRNEAAMRNGRNAVSSENNRGNSLTYSEREFLGTTGLGYSSTSLDWNATELNWKAKARKKTSEWFSGKENEPRIHVRMIPERKARVPAREFLSPESRPRRSSGVNLA